MFMEGGKCLGKGGKKICKGGEKFLGGKEKFIEGVKNEVAPKKKSHQKKFREIREKKVS